MKKTIRFIALFLAIILTALSLCSCSVLDEMKSKQAFFSENYREITYHDNTYRVMYLNGYSFVLFDNDTLVNVTVQDVPALLSSTYGSIGYLNDDQKALKVKIDKNKVPDEFISDVKDEEKQIASMMLDDDKSFNWYYVRTDVYDYVNDLQNDSSALDHYYIDCRGAALDYVSGSDMANEKKPMSDNERYVMLDEDLTAVVDRALRVSDDQKVSYQELISNKDVKYYELRDCDSKMILTHPNNKYYLFKDNDRYFIWDNHLSDEKCLYKLTGNEVDSAEKLFTECAGAESRGDVQSYFSSLEDDERKAATEETVFAEDDLQY